jgi:hypothetical protein
VWTCRWVLYVQRHILAPFSSLKTKLTKTSSRNTFPYREIVPKGEIVFVKNVKNLRAICSKDASSWRLPYCTSHGESRKFCYFPCAHSNAKSVYKRVRNGTLFCLKTLVRIKGRGVIVWNEVFYDADNSESSHDYLTVKLEKMMILLGKYSFCFFSYVLRSISFKTNPHDWGII